MAIFKEGRTAHSDRSQGDRQRHRQLVEESIKKNLGDIIAEESIIGQNRDKKIKIPIRGVKEYRFVFGDNSGGVGSGSGGEERGQVVGRTGRQKDSVPGTVGNDPGEEIYETEITMEEIINYLFEDLQLPDMERKKYSLEESEQRCKRSGYQRKGIPPKLAKKLTVIEKKKREQGMHRTLEKVAAGAENQLVFGRIPFREEDLRYFRTKEDVRPNSNAAVICIMDTSGSMERSKKYLARSFFFLLYQFVRWRYQEVEVVFVSHSAVAREVNENEFFHQGESGGTLISSGYAKALEIIEQRYSPSIWNIYAFHCTDGDNWAEDNPKAVELAGELLSVCNLFGYGEILAGEANKDSIWRHLQNGLKEENFVMVDIKKKEDVWPAFRRLLDKEKEAGGEVS